MNQTEQTEQGKAGNFLKVLLPNSTAFVAGFCLMVVELIAARIIARYLGASLYTWTAVIGVVLAGIALGNYIGGRIADRFNPQKTLSILFILASVACVIVPPLNYLMGDGPALALLSLPARTILHVAAIFFLPAVILGMISPVIAKFALDQTSLVGRTIGTIYACSALGSIVGTFVTGFLLIPAMGSIAIVWVLAAILAAVGLLYGTKMVLPYAWAMAFILLVCFAFGSPAWAVIIGEQLKLRPANEEAVVYRTESPYMHIELVASEKFPHIRKLILDRVVNSTIDLQNPADISNSFQYLYIKFYGAIADLLAKDKQEPRFLMIGGGGYVFPRYAKKQWPRAEVEVVEIDPAITQTARQFLGLKEDCGLHIHTMDARNFVRGLLQEKNESFRGYDFIYSDALNGISVPYPLTTKEYHQQLRKLLVPGGIYIVTLIDTMRSGKFLGAITKTLEEVFPYTYTYLTGTLGLELNFADTFVIVCSLRPVDLSEITPSGSLYVQLDEEKLKEAQAKAGGIILTDDYVPVDNLLEPVVYRRSLRMASAKLVGRGNSMSRENKLQGALEFYHRAVKLDPGFADAHNNLGNALAQCGQLKQAVSAYQEALRIWPDFVEVHNNLATVLVRQGKFDEGIAHYQKCLGLRPGFVQIHYNLGTVYANRRMFKKAITQYQKTLEIDPNFAQAHNGLGNVFIIQGNFLKALRAYEQAVKIDPDCVQARNNLGALLAQEGKLEEATEHYRQVLRVDPNYKKAKENLSTALRQMRTIAKKQGEKNENN